VVLAVLAAFIVSDRRPMLTRRPFNILRDRFT